MLLLLNFSICRKDFGIKFRQVVHLERFAIRFVHLPGKHRANGHKDKNTANLEDLVLSEIKQHLLQ